MFHNRWPLAWSYHHNTQRWPFNVQPIPDEPNPEPPFKEYLDRPMTALPAPIPLEISVQQAIAARLSCRRFSSGAVELGDLSTVLATGYGVRSRVFLDEFEMLERLVPSGGGLYPLELYLLIRNVPGLAPGVAHYASLGHGLETVREIELPGSLVTELFMGQDYLAQASVIVVMTAVLQRSLWKYGDRGYRYILMEAGHVAQNMNIAAACLGLGSLNLGGFFDQDLGGLLGIDSDIEVPIYGVALGQPATDDRSLARRPID